RLQVLLGWIRAQQGAHAGGACGIPERPVSVRRQHHSVVAGVHAAASYHRNHLREYFGAVLFLPLGIRWGGVSWRKHRAGDFPVEFSDQVAEVSAMVPSRRRTDLNE